MKSINGHEMIQLFEQLAPQQLAMDGDPNGLHIGTLNKPVKRVMVTLDAMLENVVEEAVAKNVDLIIAHHPPLFRPVKRLTTDTKVGKMLETYVKHDIAVYAAHTNLDVAEGGVNDLLAEALQLQNTKVLSETGSETLVKLVVFVPETHHEAVRDAISRAGAGHIGNYSDCTFTTAGEGTFRPLDGTNPFIGTTNQLEKVAEVRIETIMPKRLTKKVLQAMFVAHPYEEVAYDLLPVAQQGKAYGLGRVGQLAEAMTLRQFAQHAKEAFNVPALRFVGDGEQLVRKVAVLGGDGNKYIYDAKRAGADVLVTGDLYFHVAHDAINLGLAVVDPGHHIESIMKQGVVNWLTERAAAKKWDVEIFISEQSTEPFQFI